MKTRLLKKVRKRFDIYHYPDGYFYAGVRYIKIKYGLVDNHKSQLLGNESYHYTFDSAYEALVKKIRAEYSSKKKKKELESNVIKVWYNGNK